MARRRLKPKQETTYYHVMTRTAQQKFWLEESEIKDLFIDFIDFYADVYCVEILVHNCLSNHYHLVLKMSRPAFDLEDIAKRYQRAQTRLASPRPFQEPMAKHFYNRYTDLSMFMWEINSRMARTYNKKMHTKGHLWGGSVERDPGQEFDRRARQTPAGSHHLCGAKRGQGGDRRRPE